MHPHLYCPKAHPIEYLWTFKAPDAIAQIGSYAMMRPMSRRSAPPPPSNSASGAGSYADVSELEKYRLDSNIGKGSFGVISKVIRKSDGQEFAMKQIDYGKMTDKDKRQILAEV